MSLEMVNPKDTLYIDLNSYQHLIWEFIQSGEYKKILSTMRDGDNPLFHDGFIQGLCWASMMSVNAKIFSAESIKKMIEIITSESDDTTNVFEEEKHPLEDIISQPYKGEPLKVTL